MAAAASIDVINELPDYVIDLCNNSAENEGFTNFNIIRSVKSTVGFMSTIAGATIKGHRNGIQDELHLILKIPNVTSSDVVFRRNLFDREIYMYTVVLPTFAKFQKDKGLTAESGFYAFPKCYQTLCDIENDRYAIILEDLTDRGFHSINSLDMDHVEIVLKELGKFHAISFAMRDQVPDVFAPFKKLKDLNIDRYIALRDHVMVYYGKIFGKIIRHLDPSDTIVKEKLTASKLEFLEKCQECLDDNVAGRFCAVGHGDIWFNNTMHLQKEVITILKTDT